MSWSPDPVIITLLVTAGLLYRRAVVRLARRNVSVRRWQQASFYAALALGAVALISPVDPLGDELLSAHMAQHLLIADLAAPLAIAGVRWPVLAFFLPRPVLVPLARSRPLRRLLRFVTRPLVAIPIYVAVLYSWHLTALFEAALTSDAVHALQHQSFVGISLLVWWVALEPQRRRPRGELWKLGHILGARFAGMMLGMAFILIRVPVYTGVYPSGDRRFGLDAVSDQQTAGGLMLSLDFFVVVFALSYFFWRAAADDVSSRPPAAEPAS